MASTTTSLIGGDTSSEDELMPPFDDDDWSDDHATSSEDELMPPVDDDGSEDDTMERIPDLTIYKILIFLPPSSVTRSKAVCKRWFSLISSPSFARDHVASHGLSSPSILLFDGAARFPATIVDDNKTARLALRRWQAEPREGYGVQNCCGSIACLRGDRGGAELLNPATGDCLQLGGVHRYGDRRTRTGSKQLPWYCLGRCPTTGEYKVMRLDVRLPYSSPPHVTCEVCALGGRGGNAVGFGPYGPRWQEVGVWEVNYCPVGRGVHVDGVVYYLVEFYGHCVVAFDLSTYIVRLIDLPVVDGAVPSLSELKGRLCASLVMTSGGPFSGAEGGRNMDVWLLGDGNQHGWIHRYKFELDGAARHVPRPLFVSARGKLVMKCADGSLCSYDVEANSSIDGGVLAFPHKNRPRMMSGTTADIFVESLLPLRTILGS